MFNLYRLQTYNHFSILPNIKRKFSFLFRHVIKSVAFVDGVSKFLLQVGEQELQLAVVCRRDVLELQQQELQDLEVVMQVGGPSHHIHIPQADLRLLAHKGVVFAVAAVQVVGEGGDIPPITSCEALDLKRTFRRIQSAHSLAMAFCSSLLRSFTSKSEP